MYFYDSDVIYFDDLLVSFKMYVSVLMYAVFYDFF